MISGFTLVILAGLAAGCASNEPVIHAKKLAAAPRPVARPPARVASRFKPRPSPRSGSARKGGGVRKVGNPYRIGGRWYVPKHEPGYNRTGIASWYGDAFHGRKTANGEIYDMNALSAAHPTLPLPSYVYVTNLANNSTVMLRVNDRGPYAHGRIIDLSRAAAKALGFKNKGLAKVRVRYGGEAPLDGNDARERRFLARRPSQGGARRDFAAVGGPRQLSLAPPGPRAKVRGQSAQPRVPTWNWRPPRTYANSSYTTKSYATASLSEPRRRAYSRNVNPPRQSFAPRRGRVFVQAGTFRSLPNARALRGRLAGLGPVRLERVALGSGTGYRVMLGPLNRERAPAVLAALAARGVTGPLLVNQ